MSILRKSPAKASARQQINLRGVRDGVLLLPRNRYRMVLEVSAVNFELKSEEEQDVIIETYESFLNALPCPLQILVRIRELDIDKYLETMQSRLSSETQPIYKEQLQHYTSFVRKLVAHNKILTRTFYVILPHDAAHDDFDEAKEQLAINAELITRGLMRLGMRVRKLTSIEVMDLLHSFYNPEQAKHQPLSEHIAQAFTSSYVRGAK